MRDTVNSFYIFFFFNVSNSSHDFEPIQLRLKMPPSQPSPGAPPKSMSAKIATLMYFPKNICSRLTVMNECLLHIGAHHLKHTSPFFLLQDFKDPQVRRDWLQLGLICISNAIRHLIDLILSWDLQDANHMLLSIRFMYCMSIVWCPSYKIGVCVLYAKEYVVTHAKSVLCE